MARITTTPFNAWTVQQAEAALSAAKHELQDANKKFVEGDHWQGGAGWVGPHLREGEPAADVAMTEIQAAFTSRNVIQEVVERHALAVVGIEPEWGLTVRRALKQDEQITDTEQALIDEAEALLTTWWDTRRAHQLFQEATAAVLWAEHAALRLYIPKGMLDAFPAAPSGGRMLTITDPADAFALLWLEAPAPDLAAVVVDPDTKQEAGVLVQQLPPIPGQQTSGKKETELVFLTPTTAAKGKKPGATDAPLTMIRRILDNQAVDFPFQLGGRLTMAQITRRLMITRQVQEAQRALNLAISMVPRNVVTGGFLERVLLNVQLPGEYIAEEGKPPRFVPDAIDVGAGTTNSFQGTSYQDEDGKTHVASPSVVYRPPVDVTAAVGAKQAHYEDILYETDQAHILIVSAATLSGVSREQARADFMSSLGETKAAVEPVGRWLLETVLAMAEALLQAPGRWTSLLRATFECRLDAGPVSEAERQQNVAEVDKGTLALESAMSANGVLDVDAELQKIAARPESQLKLAQQRATIFQTLTSGGMDRVTAAKVAQFPDDQIALIQAAEGFAQQNQNPNPAPGLALVAGG